MSPRNHVVLVALLIQILAIAAVTDNLDSVALKSLKDVWQNTPPSWVGLDPCGNNWEGIGCTNSRVTSIVLSSLDLTGQLSGDINFLSELQTLDLSYNKGLTGSLPMSIGSLKNLTNLILVGCSFSGPIPDSIGSLKQLVYLSLNSNSFSGRIPPSIGNLSNLYWLDIADNQFSGTIPVSDGNAPGLDMLLHLKHFHSGNNKLTGKIPPQLFSSNMSLIHVLLENNQLTGSIPSTLGLVMTLEVVRLDRNSLSGPLPSNLNNLASVGELYLSNNKLTGPMPNLTGMNLLNYLDMSNNSFDASDFPPWLSTLQSLTTLAMESIRLQGQVPTSFFSLPHLQTVKLRNNQINGTLDIGTSSSNNQLHLIDLQNNFISGFTQRTRLNFRLILVANPICEETGVSEGFCTASQSNSSYSSPPVNCLPIPCSSDQVSSPKCKCAYPYLGTLYLRAPSFSNLENSSYYVTLEMSLMNSFKTHHLPVDSVSLSNPFKNSLDYLELSVEVFPSNVDRFNRTGISWIGFSLSNQTFKPPHYFGPFFFVGIGYKNFAEASAKRAKSFSTAVIIGATAGASVLVLLLLFAGVYAFRQKRRAEKASKNNPFASWDSSKSRGDIPQLKGARCFSLEELKKGTNNFSEGNVLGTGGFGKVYRGTLPSGPLIAVKRAQVESTQGGLEFKTEIELLSRVHHKNLVSLVGFCFEHGEQMLVYEYVPNGNLKESLSGKSGIRLDWIRRLKIALGTARGLAYLHELADPPIIHRDIKSNNILLDELLTAKVADFGLSKLMGASGRTHVTTQVKGTMGYLDPEYFMTNQLTEKSDVYSYGVLLLELITAKMPIERGKYIVKEVKAVMDTTKDICNLHEIIDPTIGLGETLIGFKRFLELAMSCVEEAGVDRPTMGDVVKEIESIMQLAGLNPNAESASTSASYEGANKEKYQYPYSNETAFEYSGIFSPPKVEPQ